MEIYSLYMISINMFFLQLRPQLQHIWWSAFLVLLQAMRQVKRGCLKRKTFSWINHWKMIRNFTLFSTQSYKIFQIDKEKHNISIQMMLKSKRNTIFKWLRKIILKQLQSICNNRWNINNEIISNVASPDKTFHSWFQCSVRNQFWNQTIMYYVSNYTGNKIILKRFDSQK